MFYQILFSPQAKRSAVISNKHGIFELPQELLNDLRLGILENLKMSGKFQNLTER